ncbi:MAG: DUF3592 domain-containing protein [Bacilli bacterium]|nr:DUF3592 domain-containing protein [Bacilli bacterium]
MPVVKFSKNKKIVIQDRRLTFFFSSIFLLIFSIVFIFSSIFIFFETKNTFEDSGVTEAKIISIKSEGSGEEKMYEVLVEYSVNNQKYQNRINFYKSSFKKGDIISIRYNTQNPNNIIYAENIYFLPICFLAIGLIAFVISALAFKKYKELRNKG